MKKFIIFTFFSCSLATGAMFDFQETCLEFENHDKIYTFSNDIDKIIKAKDIVKKMVNYPDTLVFHNLYTSVKGDIVTLKFTCKNAYGVSETHIKDINVK
jgi:hypothetical protein